MRHEQTKRPAIADQTGWPDTLVGRPYNAILRENEHRQRLLGCDEAHHPATIRRVLAELDANGPSEAGDVVQSLVWWVVLADQRAARFVDELRDCLSESRSLGSR